MVALLALVFAWVLETITVPRLGYLLFAIALILLPTFGVRPPPRFLIPYLAVFATAFALQAALLDIDWSVALFAMSTYLVIPLVASMTHLDYRRLLNALAIFKYAALILFFGLILQLIGVESPFLVVTQTATFGEVHARYGSLTGGPLLLGTLSFVGLVTCLASFPQQRTTSAKLWLLGIALMALINVYFSYARRYYVLSLLAIGLFLWVSRKRKPSLVYVATPALFIAVAVLAVAIDVSILGRLASILDFEEEGGNQLRFLLWLRALAFIEQHPFLGLGVGSEGTVGQSQEAILLRLEEGAIAEMYFLKVGVEFGAFVGLFFAVWMIALVIKSLRLNGYQYFLYWAFPLLGAVECVLGGGLASPFFAFPFWLVISQLLRHQDGSFGNHADLPNGRPLGPPSSSTSMGVVR
jgi:hypothetical protein